MNINILSLLHLLKSTGPYMLFGLYYGLLATLPVGPSQILCVRSFLLGGNLSGLVSLSGSMLAQLIAISSIYCSPIYLLLSKPHVVTILAVPYTLIFCLVIKDFPNYQILRPVTSLRDSRVVGLFLISFLFQILNPILLPNPVLTRLSYLFLFRYSTNNIFLIATFTGWVTGQVVFNQLSRLLLTRVEKDSPMLYLLAKRSIYTTFSIVSVINAVAYLGRSPVSFWTRKFTNESHDKDIAFWKIAEYSDLLWWFFKPWPISFFDPSRGNRANRFVKNCRSDINSSFYKGRTSTYFFEKCLTDGKERLSFAALPSLSIFEKQVYESIAKFRKSTKTRFSSRNWILGKLARTKIFQKELTDRVKLLDTGYSFSEAMGKRTRLTGRKKRRIPYSSDPLVNNFRIRIPIPQTFLTMSELNSTRRELYKLETRTKKTSTKGTYENNVLKNCISAKNRKWKKRNENPLPWELLPVRVTRMFQFIFKNRFLYEYEVQTILKKVKSSPKPKVTWAEIMNLDDEDRAIFLTYLKEERYYRVSQMSLFKAFLVNDSKIFSDGGKKISRLHKIEDLTMDLARNIALYLDNEFDAAGGDSDFRYRKLRNVGFPSAKRRRRAVKLVKRYAKISDFRRKFLKGSMRSRRRKTLLWKALQEKIRSAFFIRLIEIPVVLQLPIEQLTKSSSKARFDELENIADYKPEEQSPDNFLVVERSLIGESRLARSAVAARSDIGPIHNGRGYMLVFQSKFRKFIKLPVLIVLKTISRVLLRQDSEWSKDWTKWKKEIHINCTFDGEEFSQDDLPPRWSREGMQVKIVYPFRLKPWHTTGDKKQLIPRKEYMEVRSGDNQELKNQKKFKRKRPKFTYLTIMGYQTDIPFGTIRRETSLWKPVRKKLIRIYRKDLPRQFNHIYRFIDSKFGLGKILKPSSILLKKLNFLSSLRRGGKVPSEFGSTENVWMKTPFKNYVSEMGKLESHILEKSSGLVCIGGEIHPASIFDKELVDKELVDKELVDKERVENKLIADSVAVDSVNLLKEKFELNEPDPKEIWVDPVSINAISNDRNFANSPKYEQKQSTDFQEIIINLRGFVVEAIEELVSIVRNLFFTINRIFVHHFNEFIVLHTQLTRMLNNVNRGNKIGKLSRFSSSSQACLYADIWNISIKKDFDLNLLVSSKGNYEGETSQDSRRKGGASNLHEPEIYLKETTVSHDSVTKKLVNPEKIDSRVNSLTIYQKSNKIPNAFLGEHVEKYVEEWGFLRKLHNLDENNWNEWLDCFYRYNLPSVIWRGIAPQKWKVGLEEFSNIGRDTANELKRHVSSNHSYSIYAKKVFLKDRIRNFNKLCKHRNLLQNLTDFVRDGDIHNFSVRRDVVAQKFNSNNRIQKISGGARDKIGKVVHLRNSDTKIKYNLKFDLMPWLDLDVAKTRGFITKKTIKKKTRGSKHPVLEDTDRYDSEIDKNGIFQDVSDELYEIMLEEREDANYIYQWKWRLEVELDKIKNLIALTRMLENDNDLITLAANAEVNSDLLNFHLNVATRLGFFENISFISAHRLSIVFDDQNLLYKIINPLLKFKSRLKKRVNRRLYRNVYNDSYISKLFHIVNKRNCKQSCIYDVDELLLPRRRRELRFLRCLLISRKSDPKRYSSPFILGIGETCSGENQHFSHLSGLSEIQRIKRFLWPSHRLEELACTGRFCLGLTTESQFTALKIRMYPIFLS
uniref:Protein TIC 214 n=1 Tax=Cryptogramma acrostichoides TaxID=414624 RepID=A0A3G5CSG2_9MONI|nr:conserved hypothetical chloroplast protein Ycf1 [Cryptogramma acrostichoides]AYW15785.1 conserved hypothetical chloroplast protein Ycf1 [Cryptogramma acrostichoides]